MNLTAYSQIEDLMPVLQSTGIEIPRLRGLGLMKNEEPVSKTDLDEILHSMEILAVQNLCESFPAWDFYSCCSEYCPATDRRIKKYMILDKDGDPIGIRWDRIHGKKRKIAKYAIKQYKKAVIDNINVFNKYAGRDDVLFVHARIGGDNWNYFNGPSIVASHPAFLEKVDDYFDSTYCDIYLKIDPETVNRLAEKQADHNN